MMRLWKCYVNHTFWWSFFSLLSTILRSVWKCWLTRFSDTPKHRTQTQRRTLFPLFDETFDLWVQNLYSWSIRIISPNRGLSHSFMLSALCLGPTRGGRMPTCKSWWRTEVWWARESSLGRPTCPSVRSVVLLSFNGSLMDSHFKYGLNHRITILSIYCTVFSKYGLTNKSCSSNISKTI